jgi:hypothetical protein
MKRLKEIKDLPGWIQAIAAVVGVVIAAIGIINIIPPSPTIDTSTPTDFTFTQVPDLDTLEPVVDPTPTDTPVPSPTNTSLPVYTATSFAAPVEFIHELPIYDADASSYTSGNPVFRIFDNSTFWTSTWYSSEGDQIGAWVRVVMPEIYTVSQLRMYMVIPPVRDIADQPKEVVLTFDDGSMYNAQLTYTDGWQSINFPPVNTSTVQITIQDVYPSQWENKKRVSIREVQLFGVK